MGFFDFVDVPVSEKEPAGPDLEGNNEFEVILEGVAGRLPASYFDFINPDKALDLKPGFNLKEELSPLLGLLRKSHDLRVLVPAARLCILGGDIAGFAAALGAMARLLSSRWAEIHPAGVDGDFAIRESHLSLLTDRATVLFPLQFAPLDVNRRLGPLSYRSQMLASKAATPRAKEVVLDEPSIREALVRSDNFEALKEKYAALEAIDAALKQIRAAFIANAGHGRAPDLDALGTAASEIRTYLKDIINEREPSAAPMAEAPGGRADADADGGTRTQLPQLASTAEAEAALAAIENYFSGKEPSNPACLLVRQARQLVGKSFIEALVIVNPALADKAAIKIGGEMALSISAAQMKALAQQGAKTAGSGDAPCPPAATRADALALMESVEAYFLRNEPSSPIPLLLGRARSYSGKDFAMLMKEMLPG